MNHKTELKIRFLIILITTVICLPVTVIGFDRIITFFYGSSIGLGNTWLLAMAFSFLRYSPINVTKPLKEFPFAEFFARCLVAIAGDCMATFVLIPIALS